MDNRVMTDPKELVRVELKINFNSFFKKKDI